MAVHETNFTANAQQNFIIPWAEAQLYKRSRLWPYVDDRTGELMARGFPLAKGLEFARDTTSGYFTPLADSASNSGYADRGGSLGKETLETETDKNLDLVFDYSGEEIGSLTQLGVWAQRQMGRVNELMSTRDGKVYAALINAQTGAAKASNRSTLNIPNAAKFINDPNDAAAKMARFALVSHLVNAQLELWDRGLDILTAPGSGTPGYQRPVHLVNKEAMKALNTYFIADVPNGGTGFTWDDTYQAGILRTPVGGSRIMLDHHMDNTLTAAGDEYLAITFVPGAVKGLFPRRDAIPESLKYTAQGQPTPIRIIGQRYAYAVELFDENLVMSLDSVVTA